MIAALTAAFLLLAPTAAPADGGNDRDNKGTGGAFSPHLQDSPVNVIFCTVPDSCKIQPPKEMS